MECQLQQTTIQRQMRQRLSIFTKKLYIDPYLRRKLKIDEDKDQEKIARRNVYTMRKQKLRAGSSGIKCVFVCFGACSLDEDIFLEI